MHSTYQTYYDQVRDNVIRKRPSTENLLEDTYGLLRSPFA